MSTLLVGKLQKRREAGALRSLATAEHLIDLTSNDYFGFARSSDLWECACGKVDRLGSTGSRLLTGNGVFYEELEKKIAAVHRAECCLIFNTGYTANLGLIAALGELGGSFVYDLEIHASMIDAMALSRATAVPFRHNDLEGLENRLKAAAAPVFVLVESVYSISGDCAPLREIAQLCTQHGAALIVDEAHATGLFGPNGEGRVVELGLEDKVFARVHTFSKALGVHGACVLGSSLLREYLINFSRPFIYTTAMAFPSLALIDAAYEKMKLEAKRHQDRLKGLVSYLQQRLGAEGSSTPIQPIVITGVDRVRQLSMELKECGLDVRAIVSPTARRGKECLRVVLHSFNSEEEIDHLVQVIL